MESEYTEAAEEQEGARRSCRANFDHYVGWAALKKAGQSRVLKTAYIWLFLVPIAARLLHAAPATVKLVWPGEFDLHMTLPFSWRCFYASAVCVAIADFLFFLCCPGIVKEHDDADDFARAGKDETHLERYGLELGIAGMGSSWKVTPAAQVPDFWRVYHLADLVRWPWRVACAALYGTGSILFVVVAFQNFAFVIAGGP